MRKVVNLFKKLFETHYQTKITYRTKKLKKGIGGFCKKISKNKYDIIISKNFYSDSDDFEGYLKIYYNSPKEVVLNHTIIHEFCHVFDFVNDIGTFHSPTIRENSVEYFAEFMSWHILLEDKELAKTYAKNYAAARLPFMNEQARKSIECAAEVLLYIHQQEFEEISKEFYKFLEKTS